MRKIKIFCDSSVALTKEEADLINVTILPLTLIHNNKEYADQFEMTVDDVNQLLAKKEIIKTSQPNLGLIISEFEKAKEENYDYIFGITIAETLSGTHSAFNQAAVEVGLDNFTLINSGSISGIVHEMIRLINSMNEEGMAYDLIRENLNPLLNNSEIFVYPQTLDQLKVSGRISKSAGTLASLLKIKPLLHFANMGQTIDKFGTARTEVKIFDMIVKNLIENNVHPDTHIIYYLESSALEIIERFDLYLKENLGTFETKTLQLPAVIATHAGLGTMVVQWMLKI